MARKKSNERRRLTDRFRRRRPPPLSLNRRVFRRAAARVSFARSSLVRPIARAPLACSLACGGGGVSNRVFWRVIVQKPACSLVRSLVQFTILARLRSDARPSLCTRRVRARARTIGIVAWRSSSPQPPPQCARAQGRGKRRQNRVAQRSNDSARALAPFECYKRASRQSQSANRQSVIFQSARAFYCLVASVYV